MSSHSLGTVTFINVCVPEVSAVCLNKYVLGKWQPVVSAECLPH